MHTVAAATDGSLYAWGCTPPLPPGAAPDGTALPHTAVPRLLGRCDAAVERLVLEC